MSNIDDTIEAILPPKSKAAMERLTGDPDAFANKVKTVADIVHPVYHSLQEEMGPDSLYFKRDEKGQYRRLEGAEGAGIQKKVRDKVIDLLYDKFVSQKGYAEIDKDTFVKNFMAQEYGITEADLGQMSRQLNSLEEEHFRNTISNQVGQRALQAEISQLIQDLAAIKDDAEAKGTYVDGLKFLGDQINRYASKVNYQGPLENDFKDLTDASQAFNQVVNTAITEATQRKQQAGYAAPREYKKAV
ncbi:MAG: hypothetical protein GXP63_00875 [DPANN group archaeon]|nr:hypothetical protein [DPANN group archaeon]